MDRRILTATSRARNMPPKTKLRRGEALPAYKMQFVFITGGMGDFIHWTPAIRYAIDRHPHIHGYIVAPDYFVELARLWFGDLAPRFEVVDDVVPGFTSTIHAPGQLPNAMGYHLMDCGAMYFCNEPLPDAYRKMPRIHGDEITVEQFGLPERYVVVVPGGMHPARTIAGQTVNGLSDYLQSRGFTPVYLGLERTAHYQKTTSFSPTVDWSKGLNLVNQTSTLEAACILAKAKAVVGIDGGLINLAFCSRVPVVAGMTVASPKNRVPYRAEGCRTEFVVPDLDCIFCQEKNRFLRNHHFEDCLYDDYQCIAKLDTPAFVQKLETLL